MALGADSSRARCLNPVVLFENLGQRIFPTVNIDSWREKQPNIFG